MKQFYYAMRFETNLVHAVPVLIPIIVDMVSHANKSFVDVAKRDRNWSKILKTRVIDENTCFLLGLMISQHPVTFATHQ